MNQLKNGVYLEGNKYIAYADGEQVYSARFENRCVEQLNRVLRKRNKHESVMPVPAPPKAAPNAVAAPTPAPAYIMPAVTAENFIPTKDPNFVPFGEFKEVDTIIRSGMFFPIFITGPTGNGKSTMVEQACARNKRAFIRLQISPHSDEDQLIGSKTLVDGNIEIVEGPVLIAMRMGAVLLLDELDLAEPANIMGALQSILEGKPYYFKLKNEIITPAPGFTVVATANTKGRGSESGRYIGTKMLNEAFLERFDVCFEQEYPSRATELKIIRGAMQAHNCTDEEFAATLATWADALRRAFTDGSIDDLITTRRLIQIVKTFSVFKDKSRAVALCCGRFDSITKATFIEVYEKINPSDLSLAPEEVTCYN